MSELTVEEIKEQIGSYSDADLVTLAQDERAGVQAAVAAEQERRANPEPTGSLADPDYDPRKDKGPDRLEDSPEFLDKLGLSDDTPLSAPENDQEAQRRDHTSLLATDTVTSDGEGGFEITK